MIIMKSIAKKILLCAFALATIGGNVQHVTHSRNALDELYYSTIDARCLNVVGKALFLDDQSGACFHAVMLPLKLAAPDLMAEVEPWDGPYYPKGATNTFTNPWPSDSYGPMAKYICEYHYSDKAAREARAASLLWRATDIGKHKSLEIEVYFPAGRFATASTRLKDETINVYLEHNVDKGVLHADLPELLDKDGKYDLYSNENMAKSGIDEEAAIGEAVRIVKEELLPAFLNRGGTVPRFSADFEQDGVTVDLTSDAEDL